MTVPFYFPFDLAVLQICNKLMPNGFDLTPDDSIANTLKKITSYYKETGRIKVWSGASDRTIFSHPKVNHAFRAWHDYVHIINQYRFTVGGEIAACRMQQEQVRHHCKPRQARIINRLLNIEVVDQIKAYYKTGNNIVDQRLFTLAMLTSTG